MWKVCLVLKHFQLEDLLIYRCKETGRAAPLPVTTASATGGAGTAEGQRAFSAGSYDGGLMGVQAGPQVGRDLVREERWTFSGWWCTQCALREKADSKGAQLG